MKVVYGLSSLRYPIKNSVVTIGVFDGVHIGHKAVIDKMVKRARALGMRSVVVTFDPHPATILDPKDRVPSLVSLKHRIELIRRLGVDSLIVLKFSRAMAKLSAEYFVKNILIKKLGMKELYVGENFFFGRGAETDAGMLGRLSRRLGFRAVAVKPVKIKFRTVSSSLIRSNIVNGEISKAAKFLGRPVSILGTVVKGDGRGRILGFPTANINPHHEVVPPRGVYAVKILLEGCLYKGVLNIGRRPTFYKKTGDLEPTIEVHIFAFNRDIYGSDLDVIFFRRMRGELRFTNKADLLKQIENDAHKAYGILK